MVGLLGKRSQEDEAFFEAILKTNNAKKLYIMDARPKINAVGNVLNVVSVYV